MKLVQIATSARKHENFIARALANAERGINEDYAPNLMGAADEVRKILEVSSDNARALEYRTNIDGLLRSHRECVNGWLAENGYDLAQRIRSVKREIETLVPYLEYAKVITLTNRDKSLLADMCELCSGKMDIELFVEKIQPYNSPDNTVTSKSRTPRLR